MNDNINQYNANLPPLNEETLNFIDQEILKRDYNNILDLSIRLVEKNLTLEDKEFLYILIEKLSIICDKSSEIAIKVLENSIAPMVNNNDTWIKTEALIMLEKISNILPGESMKFFDLIKISLNNEDTNIREICLNIIGNLIIHNQDSHKILHDTLQRMIFDESWRVRVRVLQIIKKIIVISDNKKITINKYIELIAKCVADEDEEVQSLAIEQLLFISTSVEFKILLFILIKLISDENWQVCEKGIWLVGEVGKTNYNASIENILPKLTLMLDDPNLMIQTKIIDAFVKIGRVHPEKVIRIVLENIDDNEEKLSALSDIFIYLGIECPEDVLPIIFDSLDPKIVNIKYKEFVRDALVRLNEEIPEIIEQFVASEFNKFDDGDWRIRAKTARVLGVINFILRKESIGVWTDIKLKELLDVENDPEVLHDLESSIDQVNDAIENISLISREIDQEINLFYQQMMDLQQLPALVEQKMDSILQKKEFRELSLSLEEEINSAIKKIESYGNNIYNYRFKRLAVDLIEDWTYSRLELLEQLSDLKTSIMGKINRSREEYLVILNEKVSRIQSRIEVLSSELDFLVDLNTKIKELIFNGEDEKAREKLEHLAYIRDKIYRLESEIGIIWIENLDFKEALKEITVYWVQVKIEAQQLIYTISYNLRDLHDYMEKQQKENPEQEENGLKKDLSYELLMNEFQTLILQSTKSVQDQFERFSIITSPVKDEIRKGNFDNAENLLQLTLSQTNSSIEDFNKEIANLYSQLDGISESNIAQSNLIRKYYDDWTEIKDSLLERSDDFYEQTSKEIFLNRISSLQKIINPIPLNVISKKLSINESELLNRVFKLIETGELNAKIKENNIYLPENVPAFDKSIYLSKRLEIVGSKIHFMVRLENRSKSFLHDLTILISWPKFLDLQTSQSHPKWLEIADFNPQEIKIYHWVFSVKKIFDKNNEEIHQFKQGEMRFLLRYKSIFDTPMELDRKLDILVR